MSPDKSLAITTKTKQKCRCCTNPSSKFLELDSLSKSCEKDITYKDVLYEITNTKVSLIQEKFLTQKVCQKCSSQINNCYKFIIQAREVLNQHLSAFSTQDETRYFEDISESLIEVPTDFVKLDKIPLSTKESPIASNASILEAYKVKSEPIDLECTPDIGEVMNEDNLRISKIKEEKSDELLEESTAANYDDKAKSSALAKELDFANNPKHDKESDTEGDDQEADDPISEDDFDKDFSQALLAISCDICHKIYKDKKALRTHKRYTHMPEEKKRPCPLCSFKSSRLSNLKVHIGVVHGADKIKEILKPTRGNELQFSCFICQKSFRRKDSLQNHIRRIHQNPRPKGPRPKEKVQERFLCNYCGGSFRTKYGLAHHVVIHTGERPFPCEICQKTFKRPVDLNIHRLIHSDKKPHQCLQCGKAFKRSDKLKVHMRVHSELRPYKCNECEKAFKYPNVLNTHILTHKGQNYFQCKTCGESFSLKSSFNTHCLNYGHL